MPPDSNNSIKMEVGIEDCLHIEFEYNKSKCVFFNQAGIFTAHNSTPVQVSPEGRDRREDIFPARSHQDKAHGAVYHSTRDYRRSAKPVQRKRNNNQVRDHGRRTSARLDAHYPVLHKDNTAQGETIPIRLFLGGFDLTPTFRDVNKKFSTRYYLNLVLIDEENRRYFKQQEITIYRIPEVSFGC